MLTNYAHESKFLVFTPSLFLSSEASLLLFYYPAITTSVSISFPPHTIPKLRGHSMNLCPCLCVHVPVCVFLFELGKYSSGDMNLCSMLTINPVCTFDIIKLFLHVRTRGKHTCARYKSIL